MSGGLVEVEKSGKWQESNEERWKTTKIWQEKIAKWPKSSEISAIFGKISTRSSEILPNLARSSQKYPNIRWKIQMGWSVWVSWIWEEEMRYPTRWSLFLENEIYCQPSEKLVRSVKDRIRSVPDRGSGLAGPWTALKLGTTYLYNFNTHTHTHTHIEIISTWIYFW